MLSVGASRTDFEELVLEHLDPAACLKRLRAIMSPHPDDLEAVEPLVEFDKAKYRFTDPVDALAGVVEEKRATRGFLVTTSWFGAASCAFATTNNRLQLIDGSELKHLLAEHLNLDVRIELPKR